MFKKLILLSAVIIFALSGCKKNENLCEIATSELGDLIGILDDEIFPVLDYSTNDLGTGFYTEEFSNPALYKLQFDSQVYCGTNEVVSIQLTENGNLYSSSTIFEIEFLLNEPRQFNLEILSTDGQNIYKREIYFTVRIYEYQNAILCIQFDFGNNQVREYCDDDGTLSISVQIP